MYCCLHSILFNNIMNVHSNFQMILLILRVYTKWQFCKTFWNFPCTVVSQKHIKSPIKSSNVQGTAIHVLAHSHGKRFHSKMAATAPDLPGNCIFTLTHNGTATVFYIRLHKLICCCRMLSEHVYYVYRDYMCLVQTVIFILKQTLFK